MRELLRLVFIIFREKNLEDHFRNRGQNSTLKFFLSFRTVVAFLGAFCLLYAFSRLFRIDWPLIVDTLRVLDVRIYLIALLAYYLSFLFRGIRWKIIAKNASQVEHRHFHSSIAIEMTNLRFITLVLCGWFVNSVLWLRLGDAYRAYCLGVISKLGFPWALGTLVAERVLDMGILFVVILLSVLFSSEIHNQAIQILIILSTIIALLLCGLVLLLLHGENRVTSLVPNRVQPYYLKFKAGVLKSFKNITLITGLGLLAWLMECTRMFFVIESLGVQIPVLLIIVASMSNAVLSTFPTPGGMGFVEPGLTGILLISVVSSDAASVVLLDRSITYLSILIFGGLAFLIHHTSFSKELDSRHSSVSY